MHIVALPSGILSVVDIPSKKIPNKYIYFRNIIKCIKFSNSCFKVVRNISADRHKIAQIFTKHLIFIHNAIKFKKMIFDEDIDVIIKNDIIYKYELYDKIEIETYLTNAHIFSQNKTIDINKKEEMDDCLDKIDATIANPIIMNYSQEENGKIDQNSTDISCKRKLYDDSEIIDMPNPSVIQNDVISRAIRDYADIIKKTKLSRTRSAIFTYFFDRHNYMSDSNKNKVNAAYAGYSKEIHIHNSKAIILDHIENQTAINLIGTDLYKPWDIYVPNCNTTVYDILKKSDKCIASNESVEQFLDKMKYILQNKVSTVWFDYNGILNGNMALKLFPQIDIAKYFEFKFPTKISIFGVTFSHRGTKIAERDTATFYVIQTANKYGYYAEQIYFKSYAKVFTIFFKIIKFEK